MLNIVNVFIVLTIICIFGGVTIQGFDERAVTIVFLDRAEICKKEVGGSDCKYFSCNFSRRPIKIVFKT